MDVDSVRFYEDTVNLVLLFKSYVNGQRWAPINSGHYIGKFKTGNGDSSSIYMDDNETRLDFKMPTRQFLDTIRLDTKNKERIIIKRRN
jgi:hypothetical protein